MSCTHTSTRTHSHRSIHNKTQSVLLLLCHNETSMGRECYNFIARQQLSVLYSTSFQTLHWVPFIMGHWGKKCLLWSSEIISACRSLICWGWSLLWGDETSEQRSFSPGLHSRWCGVGERGWEFATCLCSQCWCKIPLKSTTKLTSLLHMYSNSTLQPTQSQQPFSKMGFSSAVFHSEVIGSCQRIKSRISHIAILLCWPK